MKIVVATIVLVCSAFISVAADFVAVQNGVWTDGATWGNASPGSIGVDFPGASDDAYTNGFQITVSVNATCKNLFLSYDVSNGLKVNALRTLTVTGTLTGWDDVNTAPEFPTTTVYDNSVNGTVAFTGANVSGSDYDPYVIYAWDYSAAQFRNVTFNFGASNTYQILFTVRATNTIRVQTGTLTPDTDAELIATTLTIDANASLTTNYPISGGTTSTFISVMNINGTLTSSSYVNVTTLNMGSAGVFNTSFNGSNQTQGWWYQSNAPSTLSLNSTSTINFSANANQNIWPTTYGNLTVSNGGSIVTKTLGSGSLVATNLTINGSNTTFLVASNTVSVTGNFVNNGTLSSTGTFIFSGTSSQTINGTSNSSFSLLRISNTTSSVTLNNVDITVSSELDVDASASFNPNDRNVTMNGNLRIDGTLEAGNSESTFNFSGTTSFLGTGTRTFNNISITGTLNAPSSFTLNGDFANNGTFNNNDGTVVFGGSATQNISGSSTTVFNNLTINRSVTNNGTIQLENEMSVAASMEFDADGSGSGVTTFLSSATGDASLAALPSGASVTGQVRVQRYLPVGSNAARVYRYIGVPVTGATISDWQQEFAITGNFTGASTGTGIVSTSPSLYTYNPATAAYVAYPTTDNTAALTRGVGYSAFIRSTTAITFDSRGTLVQGNQSVSIQTGGPDNGYNLIANPYPSAIDWDLVSKTGLNDAIYLKDNTAIGSNGTGAYVSYVAGVGTGGFDGIIASSQAFWVQSTGATSISFEEADKASSDGQFYKTAPVTDILRIKASGNNRKDDIVIRFKDGATDGVDGAWDAKKFLNDFINISTITNGQKYAINSVEPLICSKSFNLVLDKFTDGTYTLSFSEFESFVNPVSVSLYDAYTNQTIDVVSNPTYSFTVNADAASKGANRFVINFGPEALKNDLNVSSNKSSFCDEDELLIRVANSQIGVNYTLKSGESILGASILGNGSEITFEISPKLLSSTNSISVLAQRVSCAQELTLSQTLEITKPNIAEVVSVQNANVCLGKEATLTVNAQNAVQYIWYSQAEGGIPVIETNENQLSINSLETNVVYYVSVKNIAGCESPRQMITATVDTNPIEIPTVSNDYKSCESSSFTLQASGAQNGSVYNWYQNLDDLNPIQSSTSTSFETGVLDQNLSYFVSITNASGCEGERKEVEISIVNLNPVSISVNENILTSNYSEGNQWYLDGTIIDGATSSTIEATKSGTYSVIVTLDGCSTTTSVEMNILGLKPVDKEWIVFYPNPTSGILYVKKLSNLVQELKIYNNQGELLKTITLDNLNQVYSIDVSSFRTGVYVIKIKVNNEMKVWRFIKR